MAEATLVSARQQQPEALEPCQQLAQFYARLALGIQRRQRQMNPPDRRAPNGLPDEDGVYDVGGGAPAPKRVGDVRPQYPAAQAALLDGVVVAEIVVDETGHVACAHLLQSVPVLSDSALAAVRQWTFEPATVDGRPVPVRMVVTVNFTQKRDD